MPPDGAYKLSRVGIEKKEAHAGRPRCDPAQGKLVAAEEKPKWTRVYRKKNVPKPKETRTPAAKPRHHGPSKKEEKRETRCVEVEEDVLAKLPLVFINSALRPSPLSDFVEPAVKKRRGRGRARGHELSSFANSEGVGAKNSTQKEEAPKEKSSTIPPKALSYAQVAIKATLPKPARGAPAKLTQATGFVKLQAASASLRQPGGTTASMEATSNSPAKMAADFMAASKWLEAGDVFTRAAEDETQGDAAIHFRKAGNCYRQVDEQKAINSYQRAVIAYAAMGQLATAAEGKEKIAELCSGDKQRCLELYQEAADFYEGDEAKASKCRHKAVMLAVELEQHTKAAQLFEEMAIRQVSNGTQEHSANAPLFQALLCHLVTDVASTEQALSHYGVLSPAFAESWEHLLTKELVGSVQERNEERFAAAVRTYSEKGGQLDEWHSILLQKMKKVCASGAKWVVVNHHKVAKPKAKVATPPSRARLQRSRASAFRKEKPAKRASKGENKKAASKPLNFTAQRPHHRDHKAMPERRARMMQRKKVASKRPYHSVRRPRELTFGDFIDLSMVKEAKAEVDEEGAHMETPSSSLPTEQPTRSPTRDKARIVEAQLCARKMHQLAVGHREYLLRQLQKKASRNVQKRQAKELQEVEQMLKNLSELNLQSTSARKLVAQAKSEAMRKLVNAQGDAVTQITVITSSSRNSSQSYRMRIAQCKFHLEKLQPSPSSDSVRVSPSMATGEETIPTVERRSEMMLRGENDEGYESTDEQMRDEKKIATSLVKNPVQLKSVGKQPQLLKETRTLTAMLRRPSKKEEKRETRNGEVEEDVLAKLPLVFINSTLRPSPLSDFVEPAVKKRRGRGRARGHELSSFANSEGVGAKNSTQKEEAPKEKSSTIPPEAGKLAAAEEKPKWTRVYRKKNVPQPKETRTPAAKPRHHGPSKKEEKRETRCVEVEEDVLAKLPLVFINSALRPSPLSDFVEPAVKKRRGRAQGGEKCSSANSVGVKVKNSTQKEEAPKEKSSTIQSKEKSSTIPPEAMSPCDVAPLDHRLQDAPLYQLLVRTLSGKVICMEAKASDTVASLKAALEKRVGILPHQQRLVFAARQLDDALPLSHYDVGEGSLVELVLRLRGGGTESSEDEDVDSHAGRKRKHAEIKSPTESRTADSKTTSPLLKMSTISTALPPSQAQQTPPVESHQTPARPQTPGQVESDNKFKVPRLPASQGQRFPSGGSETPRRNKGLKKDRQAKSLPGNSGGKQQYPPPPSSETSEKTTSSTSSSSTIHSIYNKLIPRAKAAKTPEERNKIVEENEQLNDDIRKLIELTANIPAARKVFEWRNSPKEGSPTLLRVYTDASKAKPGEAVSPAGIGAAVYEVAELKSGANEDEALPTTADDKNRTLPVGPDSGSMFQWRCLELHAEHIASTQEEVGQLEAHGSELGMATVAALEESAASSHPHSFHYTDSQAVVDALLKARVKALQKEIESGLPGKDEWDELENELDGQPTQLAEHVCERAKKLTHGCLVTWCKAHGSTAVGEHWAGNADADYMAGYASGAHKGKDGSCKRGLRGLPDAQDPSLIAPIFPSISLLLAKPNDFLTIKRSFISPIELTASYMVFVSSAEGGSRAALSAAVFGVLEGGRLQLLHTGIAYMYGKEIFPQLGLPALQFGLRIAQGIESRVHDAIARQQPLCWWTGSSLPCCFSFFIQSEEAVNILKNKGESERASDSFFKGALALRFGAFVFHTPSNEPGNVYTDEIARFALLPKRLSSASSTAGSDTKVKNPPPAVPAPAPKSKLGLSQLPYVAVRPLYFLQRVYLPPRDEAEAMTQQSECVKKLPDAVVMSCRVVLPGPIDPMKRVWDWLDTSPESTECARHYNVELELLPLTPPAAASSSKDHQQQHGSSDPVGASTSSELPEHPTTPASHSSSSLERSTSEREEEFSSDSYATEYSGESDGEEEEVEED